jgi:DNA modification methylase
MNTSTELTIPLSAVVVGERFRKDYGDIEELADSISETGLIQPIVLAKVGETYELVAGGRRLTALKRIEATLSNKADTYVPMQLHHGATCDRQRPGFIFANELSLESRLEAELIENTMRQDYAWQERVANVEAVHRLKSQRSAAAGNDWGYRQTGALLNVPLAHVSYMLRLAKELRADPEGAIAQCDTFTDAYKLMLQREEDKVNAELAKRIMPSAPPPPKQVVEPVMVDGVAVPPDESVIEIAPADEVRIPLSQMLHRASCLDFMDAQPEGFADHCLTDTPYAIDMDMLDQQNPHGGMNDIARIAETHDVKENMELLAQMMPRVFRALKPNGFFVTWCDIMQWQYLYDLAIKAGFKVQRWPITWVKMHQCMNQQAQYNFTKNTEIAIVMRKPGATLMKPSSNCSVMAANSTAAKKLGHPFVKPFEVWEYLARHIALSGQTIYEPCAGVGSGVLSFLQLGYKVIATEIDEKHYNQLVVNVADHFNSIYPNCKIV